MKTINTLQKLQEPLTQLVKDVCKIGFSSIKSPIIKQPVDKVNVVANRANEQLQVYKPNIGQYNVGQHMKEESSLTFMPKYEFSNVNMKTAYFYSNVTGMDNLVDVTDDYMFKGIFSDDARTKNFLESILVGKDKILPDGTVIENLTYLKNEYIQQKVRDEAKKSMFDLQVETNKGIFIIEMQNNADIDYLKRVGFYNTLAYSQQQIKEGKSSMKDYAKAIPIVTISVLNNKLFKDAVPCVSYHVNLERKTQEEYINIISYVFIELEKFNDSKYDQSNICDNAKDWLTFMKTQNLNCTYGNDQVNSAVKYVQDVKDHKIEDYVRHQLYIQTETSKLKKAEEIGKAEGLKEGAVAMAKKMLAKAKPIAEITEFTGLTEAQIKELK